MLIHVSTCIYLQNDTFLEQSIYISAVELVDSKQHDVDVDKEDVHFHDHIRPLEKKQHDDAHG